MQIFIQVADSGNFSRAADVLGLPRSTISTALQALEDRLGCQLLHRTTRQVVLSPDGAEFLPLARRIVEEVRAAETMFLQPDDAISGRLRIDMPSRIARKIILPALPSFLEAHPGLSVELSASDRLTDLVANGVDCVVRVGFLEHSELMSRKLGDLPFITCASPEYLERFGTPQTPNDLQGHRLVNYSSKFPARSSGLSLMIKGAPADIPLPSAVTVDSAEAYISAALAGIGIIQVPAFDVQKLMAEGALTEILADYAPSPQPLSFLFIRKRNLSRRVRLFQEWMEKTLRESGVLPA